MSPVASLGRRSRAREKLGIAIGRQVVQEDSIMPISQKVSASTAAAALSTIFWTVAAATFAKNVFSQGELAALTGVTATVLAFVIGWLVPESPGFLASQAARLPKPANPTP